MAKNNFKYGFTKKVQFSVVRGTFCPSVALRKGGMLELLNNLYITSAMRQKP